MTEDLIDRLKRKEDEFDSLIAEARTSAAAIKDDAIKRVKELKAACRCAIDDAVKSESDMIQTRTKTEVDNIEREARLQAARIRSRGKERLEAAVNEALIRIVEGVGDQGDAKNPDNRAKRVVG